MEKIISEVKDSRIEVAKNLAISTLKEMTKLGFDNGQYKLFLVELEREYYNAKINYCD